jgi:Fic family protein
MLHKLLDGFEGKLKTSKWAKITKCSGATALREIKNLIGKKVLQQKSLEAAVQIMNGLKINSLIIITKHKIR